MNPLIETVSNYIQHSNFAAMFLDALIKSFVVLAFAGGLSLGSRRASAATRHLIWFLAVVSLPFLPLFSSVLPSWQRPLWSVSTGFNSGNQVSLSLELAPTAGSQFSRDQTSIADGKIATSTSNTVQPGKTKRMAAHFNTRWLIFAFVAWCGGILLALFSIAVGWLRLGKISRQARPLQETGWKLLLNEVCENLRLRRPVLLLRSADDVMPMTWGWLRPVVLLPGEADEWPAERRRVVLLHELAHVKRWDCLAQMVTRIVCAFYWFNPLVWLAARRMCVERERACDDLVLTAGSRASDYSEHLIEIARSFRRIPQVTAIAMARSSQLEKRVQAIVDAKRNRRRLHPIGGTLIAIAAVGLAGAIAANKSGQSAAAKALADPLREQQIARLETFSAAKEKQSQTLATAAGEKISPEFQRFFDAATKGDWQTVTNMYESFKLRHPQYGRKPGVAEDINLRTSYWQPVLEICLAYDHVVKCEPKYTQMAVDDIISSIPAGSIYFGGTDPGRGLPTAFSKSHAGADPFFTLTQNALADQTYLQYLQRTYGGRIYTPTDDDSQRTYQDYVTDAARRLAEHKLKPGEGVTKDENGQIQISGQVAVMSINGLLTKIVFDKNPNREFYIEESFPLDWMYPHLEPHGLIMKINRKPLTELPDTVIRQDHEYWRNRVAGMIGDWLADDTPVKTVAAFADKIYAQKNLSGFKGDPRFVENDYAAKSFSKWRSSIGDIYSWRAQYASGEAERKRMSREAEFAYCQAFALCPYSPEAVFHYVQSLINKGQISDAILVAETAAKMPMPAQLAGQDEQFRQLIETLRKIKASR
jgi:beta-lactamase regulating signal transducer with metallopeptidase domain